MNVAEVFPVIDKYLSSVLKLQKDATLEELSQQKRYRLIKMVTKLSSSALFSLLTPSYEEAKSSNS